MDPCHRLQTVAGALSLDARRRLLGRWVRAVAARLQTKDSRASNVEHGVDLKSPLAYALSQIAVMQQDRRDPEDQRDDQRDDAGAQAIIARQLQLAAGSAVPDVSEDKELLVALKDILLLDADHPPAYKSRDDGPWVGARLDALLFGPRALSRVAQPLLLEICGAPGTGKTLLG